MVDSRFQCGDIGCVHSGRVMLYFLNDVHDEEEDESLGDVSDTSVGNMLRQLNPARMNMQITGGQFYMPQFLPIMMLKQMPKKRLQTLPSDLTRLFMSEWSYYSEDDDKLIN